MGILKFGKFYSTVLQDTKNRKKISDYTGKYILVDAFSRLYRMCIGKIGYDDELIRSDGKNITAIKCMFDFISKCISKGVMPVFFFEGKMPEEKKITIDERKSIKDRAQEKYDLLEDKTSDEGLKYQKRSFSLQLSDINDCKRLLNLLGIKYVECIEEADQQCAVTSVYYGKQIAGVVTDDSDILIFGSNNILKDFTFNTNSCNEIRRNDIIKYLHTKSNDIRVKYGLDKINSFTGENFVDFSILMGSDYVKDCKIMSFDGKKNVNVEKLFELFVLNDLSVSKLYENFELKKEIKFSDDFLFNFERIKNIYLNPDVIDPSEITLCPNEINKRGLINFLCRENEMSHVEVSKRIEEFEKCYWQFRGGKSFGQIASGYKSFSSCKKFGSKKFNNYN